MKTCFILLVCFLSASSAVAQYTWSNPQPSGHINYKVEFTDATTGYIFNSDGDLIKSTDAGNSWFIHRNFPKGRAMDVKDSIFVIGGGDTTIHISRNGGQTWSKGFLNHNQLITDIQIIDKDTVFAVSLNTSLAITQLFRSVNGGITWQLVNNSFIIKSIDYIDSKLAYAASFGGIYKTTDGGVNWTKVFNQSSGYPYNNLAFFNQNIGYSYQDGGGVIKTIDGGATWTTVMPDTHSPIYTIDFVNASTIFMGGQDGVVYRSTDGGATWSFKPFRFAYAYSVYDIHFITNSTGFFVGHRGQILKTTDAADTYQPYSPTYIDIKPLSFPTPETGYAGSWTELLKTTNGGASWNKLSLPIANNSRFQHLHFFSKDTGIATAETPVQVFKTYNGGQSWQPVNLPLLSMDYIRGFFVLGNTIYMNINGGYGSSMVQSKDRGESWRTQTLNSTYHQQNLFFTDEKNGFGTLGPSLYKTTDSAKTWTAVNTFNTYSYTLNNIWFSDAGTGYIAGDGGFNLVTNDSGKTWTQFAITPGNFNFNRVHAIRFFDKRVGYLTSEYGDIYKSIDGGKNWKAEKSSPWDCPTIRMTSDTSLFLAGTYGTIIKKDMREYLIDSLKATAEGNCSARVSARITAILSSVDSIWFEYGTNNFTNLVATLPAQVKDSSIKIDRLLQELSGDSTYQVRVKLYYRGNYRYSEAVSFRPAGGLSTPVISFNGTLLTSSASSGNQWYLNGVLIPGATGSSYQPIVQGVYTVQQKLNGCASAMSASFNYITTAIIDPVLAATVQILPNPVLDNLWIRNPQAKKLRITIVDSWGRPVKTTETKNPLAVLDVRHLAAGVYTVIIYDLLSQRKTSSQLVKL